MDPRRLAPYSSSSPSEQLRIDEVRYLHSLWRQGPPRNPNPNSNNNNNNNLHPNNPTIFKKKKNKKNKGGKSRNRYNHRNEEEQEEDKSTGLEPVSEVEWPTEPIPEPRDESSWAWPDSVPQPDSTSIKEVSAEEQEKINGIQSQNKALKASKKFLSRNFGSDSEGEDFMEDDNGDDGGEESEEFKFFLNLFSEDEELRNYYDKNWERGDFPCFVCGASGRKCGKRFKTCVSLVQHSTSISNMKRAHNAFGQVLCRVLGWQFNRLPAIVLSADGPLSGVLAQAGTSQVANDENGNKVVGSVNADIAGADVNGNSAECEKEIRTNDVNDQHEEVLNDTAVNSAANVDGDSADCEAGAKENDASAQQKALDHKDVVDATGASNGEPIDCNENSRKDGVAQQDQSSQKEIVNAAGEVNDESVNKDGAAHQEQDFQKEMVNTGVEGKE